MAKIEELTARSRAARAALAEVPTLLEQFRQSVLASAFRGDLTADWRAKNYPQHTTSQLELLKQAVGQVKTRRDVPESVDPNETVDRIEVPEGWRLASIAELLRCGALIDLKDGNHGANHPKQSEFTPTGLPFITAAQVSDFTIRYETAYKVSGVPLQKLKVGYAKPGDAILTHKGSVGRSALNTQECVLTPQTTYYRCRPEVLSSEYLVYHFAASQFYGQLSGVMSQTTRDFVPISEQYRLFLLVPSVEEQLEIVRRLKTQLDSLKRLESNGVAIQESLSQLDQSILAKAFRGELVPQDPTDEPASVLLERLRAGQAEASTTGTGKRTRRKRATEE